MFSIDFRLTAGGKFFGEYWEKELDLVPPNDSEKNTRPQLFFFNKLINMSFFVEFLEFDPGFGILNKITNMSFQGKYFCTAYQEIGF
jgi:hypothetical protein